MKIETTGRTLKDDLESAYAHGGLSPLNEDRGMTALRAAIDLGVVVLDVDGAGLHDTPIEVAIEVKPHSVAVSITALSESTTEGVRSEP